MRHNTLACEDHDALDVGKSGGDVHFFFQKKLKK
jgi:hypothetical protein